MLTIVSAGSKFKLWDTSQREKMYLQDVLKTSLQDWSSRRVWRLKNAPGIQVIHNIIIVGSLERPYIG